jgi:hypothetical protein
MVPAEAFLPERTGDTLLWIKSLICKHIQFFPRIDSKTLTFYASIALC